MDVQSVSNHFPPWAVWTCRVYPFPPSAVLMHKVYRAGRTLFHHQQCDCTGCIPVHHSQCMYVSLFTLESFLKCRNSGLSSIRSLQYWNEQKCWCHNQSCTRTMGPSLLPECFCTRWRYRMLKSFYYVVMCHSKNTNTWLTLWNSIPVPPAGLRILGPELCDILPCVMPRVILPYKWPKLRINNKNHIYNFLETGPQKETFFHWEPKIEYIKNQWTQETHWDFF